VCTDRFDVWEARTRHPRVAIEDVDVDPMPLTCLFLFEYVQIGQMSR